MLLSALLLIVIVSYACAAKVKTPAPIITLPQTEPKVFTAPDKTVLEPLDPQKFSVSKSGVIHSTFAYEHVTCTQMPNGKILAAWQKFTDNNSSVGEAVIFSSDMQYITSVYYTEQAKDTYIIGENVAFALDNNTVLIAYTDARDNKGKYVLLNDSGNVVKGPVIFNNSNTNSITITYLPGRKTILLAYQKLYGVTGRGEYQVLNEAGNKLWGPVIFNNKGYTTSIGAAVSDGLIFLTYNCAYGKNKVYDLFGNMVRDEVKFMVKPLGFNQPLTMDNGNILLVYQNDVAQGMTSILSPQGTVVSGPAPFTPDSITGLSSSRLNDGNIFVLYTRSEGSDQRAVLTALDQNGNRVKELKLVSDEYSIWHGSVAHTVLLNGKVLIIYGSTEKNQYGNLTKQFTNYMVISAAF